MTFGAWESAAPARICFSCGFVQIFFGVSAMIRAMIRTLLIAAPNRLLAAHRAQIADFFSHLQEKPRKPPDLSEVNGAGNRRPILIWLSAPAKG